MKKSLRFIGLCVSSLVLVALIGYVFLPAARAQGQCPCDFNTIPKTTACWADPFTTEPLFNSDVDNPPQPDAICITVNSVDLNTLIRVRVLVNEVGVPNCSTFIKGLTGCGTELFIGGLTEEEFEACLCDLEAYTTELNNVAEISVSPDPPYICSPSIDCTPPPPPTAAAVPTISEWGLIAIAVVLGIVGYLVMSRRKVSA